MKRLLFVLSLVLLLFLSGCESILSTDQFDILQAEIDDLEAEIETLGLELSSLKEEIEAQNPRIAPIFSYVPEDQIIQYGTNLDLLSLGLEAIDNLDGDITNDITVNITDTTQLILGNHAVNYMIVDSDGNVSTETITITVQFTSDDFDYIFINNNTEIKITEYYISAPKDAVIPNLVGGIPVTEIGFRAFAEIQLTSVIIPDNVIIIGDAAFYGNLLTNVTIGNGVTTIGDRAFSENKITTITIPDSVIVIVYEAFAYNQLTSVIIGSSVTTIGDRAFVDNNPLTSIIIPDSVIVIGAGAFGNCLLTSITIPDSVTTIGARAFSAYTFTDYIISENNPYFTIIDGVLFNKDITILIDMPTGDPRTSYIIPDSVTTIGKWAFSYSQLTNISIPDSVTTIEEAAFYSNSFTEYIISENNLYFTIIDGVLFNKDITILIDMPTGDPRTSYIIPDSVTTIGNRALSYSQLTNISIPDSVIAIGAGAFEGSPLTSITIFGDETRFNDNWESIGFPEVLKP